MKNLHKTIALPAVLLITLIVASPILAQSVMGTMDTLEGMEPMKEMGGMKMPSNAPTVPAVTGYSEGQEILFIHTETSGHSANPKCKPEMCIQGIIH